MGRQASEFLTAVSDAARGPLLLCEQFPSGVKTFLSVGHGPGGMTFVQKRLAPLDQLAVDLLDDLPAENAIAPAGERLAATRSLLLFRCGCSALRR